MLAHYDISHIIYTVEQRDLGPETRIALNCVRYAVVFIYYEIICKYTVECKFFSKSLTPFFYLIIFLMFPVET